MCPNVQITLMMLGIPLGVRLLTGIPFGAAAMLVALCVAWAGVRLRASQETINTGEGLILLALMEAAVGGFSRLAA